MGGGLYGMEALNVLRIEKGFITHAEIHGRITAFDLGFQKMMSSKKDFIGKTAAMRPGLVDDQRDLLIGLKPINANDKLYSGSYLFELKAIFQFEQYDDNLIELAINNNCLDIQESKNGITLEFDPSSFKNAYESFNSNSYKPSNAELANIPSSSINLNSSQFTQISKLIESLEDLDDVQDVYANFDIEEKDLESLLSE